MLAAELMQSDDYERVTREWASHLHLVEHETFESRVMARLTGKLFVQQVELPRLHKMAVADPGIAFVDLPFAEAIQYAESIRLVTGRELDSMMDVERELAVRINSDVSDRMAERIVREIQRSIGPDGPGLGEFIRIIQSDAATDQSRIPSRRSLESTFRTSTSQAYGAGRFAAQTDPDIIDDDSLVWEYLTVADSRVRPTHRALHGKQWLAGDEEARRAYPPNGYQCRCVIIVTDTRGRRRFELHVNVDAAITPGFEGAPGALAA